MDLASLIGIVCSFGIIFYAMFLGGSLLIFIDIPSVLIVIVGSMFVVLAKFTISNFLGAFKAAGKAFKFKSVELQTLIEEIVTLSDEARKGGLLSLEGKEISHPFLANGIKLLVDGHEPDVVQDTMTKDMKKAAERHSIAAAVFVSIADAGPAMGMIGTLVGLVQMLGNMSDPKSIGPAMAVALLTTLYGAMLANMLCLPIADKLKLRAKEEIMTKSIIIDAVTSIQAGLNPRVIRNLLNTYLPSGKRPDEDN